jgi:CRP-like cAMP-binding protein
MPHFVIDYLRNFSQLSENEELAITSRWHYRKVSKNQLLISAGDVCDKIIFIKKGAVRIFNCDSKGNEITYLFAFDGQPLTDPISFFEQVPSEFSADTMEATEFYWTSHAEFQSLLEAYPKFEKAVRSIIVAQMPREKQVLKYQREGSAREKYEGLEKTHPEIITRVPLKYIASYLGITGETLSRIRGKK